MREEWILKNVVVAGMTVVLFGILPCSGESDTPSAMLMNNSFFEGVPVLPTAEVLMVMVDTRILPHGEADAELIQYPKIDSDRRPDSCGLDSSPAVPFTLDCGARMLGLEARGDQAVYYFLLKSHQGDWYQIVLSPQSGATTWIKDQYLNGLVISSHRLVDWLQSLDSYATAHEMADSVSVIPVRVKPQDESKDITDCSSYQDGEGLIPADDKARIGDWVHVTCVENDCFAVHDPQRSCLPQWNLQGVPCVQGWARWRTKDGHLVLYPSEALPQGC
jgi:hypothetical protein